MDGIRTSVRKQFVGKSEHEGMNIHRLQIEQQNDESQNKSEWYVESAQVPDYRNYPLNYKLLGN